MKLTEEQAKRLTRLKTLARRYLRGDPVNRSLENRNLARLVKVDERRPYREFWSITPAGRSALASHAGERDG